MHNLSIYTGADLKQWTEADLVAKFGKVGRFYYKIARGEDDRPVQPHRIRKSIGAENSYDPDLSVGEASPLENRARILRSLVRISC